jgi:2-dehydropantoate 2-reductase
MKILIVGAGGIGGYFGGRLLAAGRDVTFLVRPGRAAQLAEHGLVIKSPSAGDVQLPAPPMVQASGLDSHFDLVLLSCKAYDLADAMQSFAPAVGPNTMILPMLNGIRHIEVLEQRFGARAVLGGLCFIASTLGDRGEIHHLNANHLMVLGERDGSRSARIVAVERELAGANFDVKLSERIVQEMWEKWVFIATGAGITCLMRGSVGEIEAAGGAPLAASLLADCASIASDAGFPPSAASLQHSRKTFTAAGSTLTASMFRDMERGGRTEGEHVLGDLLRRGRATGGGDADNGSQPSYIMLRAAYTHVATYEARRTRSE